MLNALHRFGVMATGDNLIDAQFVFDQREKNIVQRIIRRQAVFVFLVGAQFGAWRFVDNVLRNDKALRPNPPLGRFSLRQRASANTSVL